MWVDIFLAFFTLLLGLICIGMSYASWRIITHKVPSIPTGKKIREAMITMAELTKNQNIYDLGCGFGGILFAAQKRAPKNTFTGFDVVDPVIWWCRFKAFICRRPINFQKKDFFTENFTEADVIFCYLWPSIMDRIYTEIWPNLKPGTKLISHAFKLPGIKPVRINSVKSHKIYTYVK